MSDDFNPFSFSIFSYLLSGAPEPMTNAGRYLRQLDTGDQKFARNDEAVSDEIAAALRRIQITSAKDQP
jgi:hypothetical protein